MADFDISRQQAGSPVRGLLCGFRLEDRQVRALDAAKAHVDEVNDQADVVKALVDVGSPA